MGIIRPILEAKSVSPAGASGVEIDEVTRDKESLAGFDVIAGIGEAEAEADCFAELGGVGRSEDSMGELGFDREATQRAVFWIFNTQSMRESEPNADNAIEPFHGESGEE